MDTAVETLLAGPHHAVVGVNRATGAPQLTVAWFLWDGAVFRFSTARSRARYLNPRRDLRPDRLLTGR